MEDIKRAALRPALHERVLGHDQCGCPLPPGKQSRLNPSMWIRSTQRSLTRYPTSGASSPGATRWKVNPPCLTWSSSRFAITTSGLSVVSIAPSPPITTAALSQWMSAERRHPQYLRHSAPNDGRQPSQNRHSVPNGDGLRRQRRCFTVKRLLRGNRDTALMAIQWQAVLRYPAPVEWTAARIRRFREVGLCLSQEEFARTLGFAKRTVGNAERGAHPPGLALRRALDHALENASGSQRDRFLAARPDPHSAATTIQHTDPTLESVELLRHTEASELGAGTLEQLEELVEQLGVEYFAISPAEFREKALSWRRCVVRLLEGCLTLHERRRLYAVAGWLSGLIAEASLIRCSLHTVLRRYHLRLARPACPCAHLGKSRH